MIEPGTVTDIRLNESEKKLIVNSLLCLRHELGTMDIPTQDINQLIVKVIESPERKIAGRDDREDR